MKVLVKFLLRFLALPCTIIFAQSIDIQSKEHDKQTTFEVTNKMNHPGSLSSSTDFRDQDLSYTLSRIHRRIELIAGYPRWEPLGDMIVGGDDWEWFGTDIAMSDDGRTIASGAPYDDLVRVYQFVTDQGRWIQLGDDINVKVPSIDFGSSIDLCSDGTRIVVGNPRVFNDIGLVRIYEYKNSSWGKIGSDLLGHNEEDDFGSSVSISGDGAAVAVGAYGDEGIGEEDGMTYTGSVQVYTEISGSWKEVGNKIVSIDKYNDFGYSVRLSKDALTLVVGAPSKYYNGSGRVDLYRFGKTMSGERDWIKVGSGTNGNSTEDHFGTKVSLSGDGTYIGVSSYRFDEDITVVKVYQTSGSEFVQVGNEVFAKDYYTDFSLSHDAKRLIVGDASNDEFGKDAGRAQVFQLNDEVWEQVGHDLYSLDESGKFGTLTEDHLFGRSVAISRDGTTVAVTSRTSDLEGKISSGHVRVFKMALSSGKVPRIQTSRPIPIALICGVVGMSFIAFGVGGFVWRKSTYNGQREGS